MTAYDPDDPTLIRVLFKWGNSDVIFAEIFQHTDEVLPVPGDYGDEPQGIVTGRHFTYASVKNVGLLEVAITVSKVGAHG